MRRAMETDALHGPWPDEVELERLREQHPGWRIWRAVTENMTPGDWCAQNTESGTRTAAPTADGLRQKLAGGE